MENGKKSFLIFDRRQSSKTQDPLIGTFNPLETRSLNEIYSIIFQLIGVPEYQRDACTITFRNCSDLIYISSPCDLMGQDDISAYVIDREIPKLEDQTSTHGEFERIDSIPLQHINPMPLFTTNQKDIGQISRRGQSTEIPLERVHFIPKFYEMNQMSPKFNKFKAIQKANEMSMIPKTDDNDGSVKTKIQKYRRTENRNNLSDYTTLKIENESLLRRMRELELTLKNEQQAFCNLESRLIEQNKLAQFIKAKCDEEWEQKRSKLYSQMFAKHMTGIDNKIENHIESRIANKSSEINRFLCDLIEIKLCNS